MTAIAAPQARLDLGRVLSRTFGAIGANFVTFLLLAILLAAIPGVLIDFGISLLSPALYGGADASSIGLWNPLVVIGAAGLGAIPTYILIGALTQGSIVHYNGGKAGFGECLATGFRFFLPLLGLGILIALGVFLWALLTYLTGSFVAGLVTSVTGPLGPIAVIAIVIATLVPTILAIIRWSVAAPCLVVERVGIQEAFGRSIDLTHDNRWAIFFLGLFWIVILSLIQWALSLVGTSFPLNFEQPLGGGFLTFSAVSLLSTTLTTMILAAGQAALYYELRVTKEGATSEELAKIFE